MAMATRAFDTHKAVKSLTDAGAAEPLAEAMVATIGVAMDENMATKSDLQGLEQRLRQEIDGLRRDMDGLRQEVHKEIGGLRQEMHKEIGGLRQSMEALRQDMEKDRENLKNHLIVRMGGIAVACTIILGIVIKL